MSQQDPSELLLAQLREPLWAAPQVATLRLLKHQIVGHEQTKELWIRQGIVPYLARILCAIGAGIVSKDGAEQGYGETRLQATIIVGSLALGE